MRTSHVLRLSSVASLTILATAALVHPATLGAQQAPAAMSAAASTRATATLSLSYPRVPGQPAAKPLTVVVDYGVPHARGRAVPAELSHSDTIWRTGANTSTTMTTEANLVIGGTAVPAGAYSLYTVRQGDRYFLIVNRNTGQWGTEYDASKDLARIPMTARTLAEPRESLQIAFVPANSPPARGVFTIAWGKLELSADWTLR
jgi:hypothetical protein